MQAYKDDVIGQNTKGIEFLFKKNKIDWLKGWGPSPRRPGKVKVGDEVHEAKAIVVASGSEPSSLPGDRDRREGRRDLRGRAVAGQGAEEDGRDRRGRDRAGARLRLRAARRRGAGDRIPRPHHAGHGRGSVQDLPAAPEEAGAELHPRRRRSEGRCDEDQGQGDLQAAQGRQRGTRSTPTWCSWPPAGGPTPTGWASRRWA
jgi:hypothetical protein